MPYTYDYPRPMLTVDIFLLRLNDDHLEVLLIQRKNDPFKDKWALPGGYVEIEELPEAAAERELFEETGISNIPLRKIDFFGEPGRDPRGRTITIVYSGAIPPKFRDHEKAGDDAADTQWFALDSLPELAFDHHQIIKSVYNKFQSNFLLRFWFILLLDEEFSLSETEWLFSKITETKSSAEIFRAILHKLPFVKAQEDYYFSKQISNEKLLMMDDIDISRIWQNILMTPEKY